MMADAEACLRPGGIIIFMDGDMRLYKDDFVSPIPVGVSEEEGGDPTAGSWMARLARGTRVASLQMIKTDSVHRDALGWCI
jgi:hypothetical protein